MNSPKILVVGECYGEQEAWLQTPFVGAAGRELISLLREGGILPDDSRRPWEPCDVRDFWLAQTTVSLTNVFNQRPNSNDIETFCTNAAGPRLVGKPPLRTGKYIRAEFQPELERLAREIADLRPNLVLALGGTASWALLGDAGIKRIRGAVARTEVGRSGVVQGELPTSNVVGNNRLDGMVGGQSPGLARPIKVLPTYHPAAVLREHSLRHVTVMDMRKAAREAAFPDIRRPQRRVFIEPSLEDLAWFYNTYLAAAEYISIDIETQGRLITCIGFAPSPDVALVVPFRDMRKKGWSYWQTAASERSAWAWVRQMCALPGVRNVLQNGMYDSHFLWREMGIPCVVHEDTMLLHHALQPESPKGLGFLGSCYTNEASWKLLNMSKGTTYKKEN